MKLHRDLGIREKAACYTGSGEPRRAIKRPPPARLALEKTHVGGLKRNNRGFRRLKAGGRSLARLPWST